MGFLVSSCEREVLSSSSPWPPPSLPFFLLPLSYLAHPTLHRPLAIFTPSAMPTFIFLRSSLEVERLRGADPARLTSLVKTLSGPAPEGGWPKGKGNTLGGGPGAGEATEGGGWVGAVGGMNPLLVSRRDRWEPSERAGE